MSMTWLATLAIAAIVVFLIKQKKANDQLAEKTPAAAPAAAKPKHEAVVVKEPETDEAELIAVLTAAIAEFEGNNDFQVIRIREKSMNWALSGRCDQHRSQL